MCSNKSGCNRAKVAIFGLICCNRAKVVMFEPKWLYAGIVVEFGQKGFIPAKVVVFEKKRLYSGKVVVHGQKCL